jgi:LPXTG-motif cell wall-anchored protein
VRVKQADGSENNVLKVTVQFKDPSGKDNVKEREIPINIKEVAKTGDNTFLFVVGAAIVVIIGYLLTRKKDKK